MNKGNDDLKLFLPSGIKRVALHLYF